MSHESGPAGTQTEAPATLTSLITRPLNVLRHPREAAAITFAATFLALIITSANPLPTSTESQANTPAADNNPQGLVWSQDLTITPEGLGKVLLAGVLYAAIAGTALYVATEEDN